ncbi:hypothetical protein COLO4_14493 [Corchorus olitorius]|uniref:Uncharacterized protein n=1 Tax=Corchorus olitorius TaxID=93759 RepID=A0A1R3JRZ2_9ROSI|nr:hypothetical protein COLO4_14493 [Corchorus olitorius]
MKNSNAQSEEADWEVRPGGMLVQRRDEQEDHLHPHKDNHETVAASSGGPMIKINISHGPAQHELFVPAHSTFGSFLTPSS